MQNAVVISREKRGLEEGDVIESSRRLESRQSGEDASIEAIVTE